tara:strand:- start:1395 stop:1574 length:180 start_codon:yes stop_codon:yes gene_type:complete
MGAKMKHYFKNGAEYNGPIHKTNGMAMSGKTHTKASRDLFHMKDLSPAVIKKMNQRPKY